MKSIRKFLTLSILGASMAISLVGFVSLYLLLRHSLYEQIDSKLRSQADSIASECLEDISKHKPHKILRELDEMLEDGIVPDFFELRDSSGQIASRSPALGNFTLLPTTFIRHPYKRSLELPNGQHLRVCYLLAKSDERTLEIAVGTNQHELDEALNSALIIILVSGFLMSAATVFLFPILLKKGLLPLDTLGHQFNKKTAANLEDPINPHNYPEEIHPLINHFNQLLQRIAASLERERRVNADLAHELRTPLAELRLMVESAIKWPESNKPELIHDVLEICKTLESMTEHMLSLAQGEQGKVTPKSEPFNLESLVGELTTNLQAQAMARRLKFETDHDGASFNSDPDLIRMLLQNLLENACNYADEGGTISITSSSQPTGAFSITISNPASDLEQDDLQHLFERYWRKQASRTDTGKHLGLGLSIVASFAKILQCELSAQLDPNSTLSITLKHKPNVKKLVSDEY